MQSLLKANGSLQQRKDCRDGHGSGIRFMHPVLHGIRVKTIPAVREAIEQKQWKLAEEQVVKVAQVIEGEASLVDSAATELEKLSR